MLSLLYAYLCVPSRLRFIFHWLAMCLFILVLALALILFARVLLTLRDNHGHWLLHPQPHQPMSPDFIRYRPNRQYHSKEGL